MLGLHSLVESSKSSEQSAVNKFFPRLHRRAHKTLNRLTVRPCTTQVSSIKKTCMISEKMFGDVCMNPWIVKSQGHCPLGRHLSSSNYRADKRQNLGNVHRGGAGSSARPTSLQIICRAQFAWKARIRNSEWQLPVYQSTNFKHRDQVAPRRNERGQDQ